ncbi:hypothetical protein BpHYR1_013392 [Brachionus plicatilis]|uniref:Uncharacterized protein n=1 Tax=Brachionus plicatilis TaxID=10195 RepID=A0A3M7PLQ3_BRAPC|nr:hypothetical protein BpHYR1_013392 [Brachionus plicatilis]
MFGDLLATTFSPDLDFVESNAFVKSRVVFTIIRQLSLKSSRLGELWFIYYWNNFCFQIFK